VFGSYDVHYDARFGRGLLEEPEQKEAIKVLVQTYLATFRDLGVQTWLMHGTLLGWWWGKKVTFAIPLPIFFYHSNQRTNSQSQGYAMGL
jgi:hypothetical protein